MSALSYSNNLQPIVDLPLRINYAKYALAISDGIISGQSIDNGDNGSVIDLEKCFFRYNLDSVENVKNIVDSGVNDNDVSSIDDMPVTYNSANAIIDYAISDLKGPRGVTGAQGFRGTTVGIQGPTGTQGFTGARGITGAQGSVGPQGEQGPSSQVGDRGVQGATGVQGPTGSQGFQGITGKQGLRGRRGSQGITGWMGGPLYSDPNRPEIGYGIFGAQGPIGPQGRTGAQGPAASEFKDRIHTLARQIPYELLVDLIIEYSKRRGVQFTRTGDITCNTFTVQNTLTAKAFYEQ